MPKISGVEDQAKRVARGGAVLWVLGVIALLALGYGWFVTRNTQLSEAPERRAGRGVIEPRESRVIANLSLTYDVLHRVLNSMADRLSGSDSGSEEVVCVKNNLPKFKGCIDAKWDVSYRRNGDIHVAKAGDLVRVTIPVTFDGGAGFKGAIADALDVDRKKIDGAAVVSASFSVSLDDRFCPLIQPGQVDFSWTKEARVQVIGRSRILGVIKVGPSYLDVGRHFNGKIRHLLNDALKASRNAIPCEPVRAKVAKLWHPYSFALALDGQPPIYVNAQPTRLGVSKLLAEQDRLRILAQIGAKVTVATTAQAGTDPLPLPTNETVEPQPGLLDLAVPLKVSYEAVKAAASSALVGKVFDASTPAGKVSIKVIECDVYPSGDRLALGANFSADLPSRPLDVKGIVWLVAKPVVDSLGKVLTVTDVAVTRRLDNDLWNLLSTVFSDTINKEVTRALRIDLGSQEADLMAALNAAVEDPARTGGVRLKLVDPSANLGRVAIEESTLAVEALVRAQWQAQVEEIKF